MTDFLQPDLTTIGAIPSMPMIEIRE